MQLPRPHTVKYAAAGLLLCALLPFAAGAMLRQVESVEWKALHAETVVAGKVIDAKPQKTPGCYMCTTVTIEVSATLKGASAKKLDFMLKAYPAEYPGEWAKSRHEMLFFLSVAKEIEGGGDGAIDLDNLSDTLAVTKNGVGLYDKDAVIKTITSALIAKKDGTPKSQTVMMELTLINNGQPILLPKGNRAAVVVPAE